jgi:hypothetical protein
MLWKCADVLQLPPPQVQVTSGEYGDYGHRKQREENRKNHV